ncbi:MAG: class I SAM-dependent methyltransferase [Planctomycetota bacterium]|jgi:SAM-dependent methyltransferase
MDVTLYEEMYSLEGRHWWFRAKRRVVLSVLDKLVARPADPSRRPRVCDVGCGCGMMLRDLLDRGYDAVGLDASPVAVQYCAQRGVPAMLGTCGESNRQARGGFDAVLMLDVLEHIDDDRAACLAALRMLTPGGVLVCTVPAHPWLWTRRDEFHHHKRRYTARRLRQLLATPASETVLLSPMNCVLFPLALGERLACRLADRPKQPGDLRIPGWGINRVLESVFASERMLLRRGVPLPFGLSLIAAVRAHPAAGQSDA